MDRATQSGLGEGFGLTGERVAKIAPLRVIVTCSPSSIHLDMAAKWLRRSRTVAVFMRDTEAYHGCRMTVNLRTEGDAVRRKARSVLGAESVSRARQFVLRITILCFSTRSQSRNG